ncbi:hypothetical protein I309_06449 [Cryptococcus deuterogattii LA55]|nr:hypothetical protein I309_06449 [Cryptococcus deuterogattii LA55]KIR94339.1 hypothetical protein I304_01980 [Cryptococcus deuterogattii CBS 10090]
MSASSGYRIVAERDIEVGELLLSLPKFSILSQQTASLSALTHLASTSHTILNLSLCLLHEIRLFTDSKFYGYLQSLPRDMGAGLPLFWGIGKGTEVEDGERGLQWLKGTEAEKELRKSEKEGLSLPDVYAFYLHTSHLLPPTSTDPLPSPFLAFVHAYMLISTRAFRIDLYHLTALCPFADLLNHSAIPHTCLASDDFVCYICGSLNICEHDLSPPDGQGENGTPRRLAHLPQVEITRLKNENDNIEMRLERRAEKGEEVFNTYGDISDGRLLVEYGFIGEEFADPGVTWEMEEIFPNFRSPHFNLIGQGWVDLCKQLSSVTCHSDGSSDWIEGVGDADEGLLCPQEPSDPGLLNLDQSARLSVVMFALCHLRVDKGAIPPDENLIVEHFQNVMPGVVPKLARSWTELQQTGVIKAYQPSTTTIRTAKFVYQLLQSRLNAMHKPQLSQAELLDFRDSLDPIKDKRQILGLTLAINERGLLRSALNKWLQFLSAFEGQ